MISNTFLLKGQQRNFLTTSAFLVLCLCILVMNFFRLTYLETSPPGFYIDEATGAIHALCVSQTLHDAWHDKFLPLFFQADTSGIHGPFYIYPLAAWGSIFGFSIFTLRLFSATIVLIGVIGVYYLSRILFNKSVAFYALLIASCSPWAFHNSKLSWDASLVPTYVILGVLFFLRKSGKFNLILSLFFFTAACYTYAAARVTVPILIFALCFYDFAAVKKSKLKYCSYFITMFFLFLPLAYSMKYGLLSSRIETVSIFGATYRAENGLETYVDIFKLFLFNLSKFLSWNFLVIDGDYINYRHSTKLFGALSWPQILGIGFLPFALLLSSRQNKEESLRERNTLALLVIGVFAGLSPAALTWDSLPHALRASSAWPFFAILSAYGLAKIQEHFKYSILIVSVLSLFFVYKFLYAFYFVFPIDGASFFDVETKEYALKAKTYDDWKLNGASGSSRRMYMYFMEGSSCVDSKKRVYE